MSRTLDSVCQQKSGVIPKRDCVSESAFCESAFRETAFRNAGFLKTVIPNPARQLSGLDETQAGEGSAVCSGRNAANLTNDHSRVSESVRILDRSNSILLDLARLTRHDVDDEVMVAHVLLRDSRHASKQQIPHSAMSLGSRIIIGRSSG